MFQMNDSKPWSFATAGQTAVFTSKISSNKNILYYINNKDWLSLKHCALCYTFLVILGVYSFDIRGFSVAVIKGKYA